MTAPHADDYLQGRADALARRVMKRRADFGDTADSMDRAISYSTGYHDVHGDDHYWMPPQRYVAKGPMEGEWFIEECWFCNAGSILDQPGEPGSALNALAAQLEHKGCKPRTTQPPLGDK